MPRRKGKRGTVFALCVWVGSIAFASARNPVPSAQAGHPLDSILDKARKYCQRLDEAALDFVCREEVKERVNLLQEPAGTVIVPTISGLTKHGAGVSTRPAPPEAFRTTTYVYDYLFIRKGSEVTERRDLVKKGGEDVVRKDAPIETRHFKFRNILFGPSLLVGEAAAADHAYELLKNEKVKGEAAAVVACQSRPENAEQVLTGRVWVRLKDGAVLRISWDPESFDSYEEVLAVAKGLTMNPALTSETEFGVERNGLRFPSLDKTEEVYKSGTMTFTRSTTTIKYDAYKFFTVETEYKIGRG
ncbi:MAG: hypothetical protein OEW18_09875 [Candidatus Aminicenantes bacterium]|nr:hypothetical protein [Candidatus Aminicenantes bacterium]